MNKNTAITLLASAILVPSVYAAMPVTWHVNPAMPVYAPALVDSVDIKGKPYSPEALLSTALPLTAANNGRQVSDTLLTLSRPTADGTMQVALTDLRSSRFAKGKLVVKCPARHVVYIDGKEQGRSDKTGGTTSVSLTLEPERDYAVAVNIFSLAADTVVPAVSLEWENADPARPADVRADAGMKRRLLLDDTAFGARVAGAAVSADGRWLLTTISDRYDVDGTVTESVLRDLRTGKEKSIASGLALSWMPKSALLCQVEKAAKGYDVYLIDPADMSRRRVATGLPEKNIRWNATEDLIIYAATDKAAAQDGPLHRVSSPAERVPGVADRNSLMAFDPASGMSRRLTYGGKVMICDMSPDGDRILFLSQQETPTQRPFDVFTLMELNVRTMKLDTVVPTTGFIKGAVYSPDGERLLLLGSADAFDGVGRAIGRQPKVNDYDTQAFIFDRKCGTVDPISVNFDPSIDGNVVWNRADGRIYMQVTEGFESPVYSYDVKTKSYKRLPLGIDVLRSFSMGSHGPSMAYWGQDGTHAGSARLFDVRKGTDKLLYDPLAERLSEIETGKYEQWTFTASDGTSIDGYICYPPEFDPAKKYPLIVYYYGGTMPTQHGISSPYSPQLFASRDYVVYVLNPSGTVGYGQEFAARHVDAWGKRTAEDIIEGTKELCRTHPFINPDKIGCLGASYGGFMTQYLQTLTPMFAAAVSHAGISNVTSYWGEGYWGYSYNSVAAADSYPWQNPDLFTKQGSLFNADKINTPLLLLHGSADTNVPVGESIQLYNALKILGRPVELITVDGENHFISDFAKRRLWHNTIMAWFARYLQDDPSWWNEMYSK